MREPYSNGHRLYFYVFTRPLSALEAGMPRFDSSFGGLGCCPFVPGAAVPAT